MSERLIRLGLHDQEIPLEDHPGGDLAAFCSRLLTVISATAVESETLRTSDFRTKLEECQSRLENAPVGDPDRARIAGECLRICSEYLNRARAYLLERECEFVDVIDVMRGALNKLAGEANAFSVTLMSSSERLNRLIDIEDLRDLKKRIADEANELTRTILEKQHQDELNYAKLSMRIEVLRTNLNQAEEKASIDPLTRVANRGTFDQAVKRWVKLHREHKTRFVLAMLDIDDFKVINDAHGHQVGDRVLFCAAQWFLKYIRDGDFLARYGGEEFVIMLANVGPADIEARFADMLVRMAACSYEYEQNTTRCTLSFTASCGLAEFTGDESAEHLLRRADEALYAAKRTGKNRVVLSKKSKSWWKTLKPFTRGGTGRQ